MYLNISPTIAWQKTFFYRRLTVTPTTYHCLISLGKDQNIAKIAQLLKGESSFWINQQNFIPNTFSWQDDYFAASVSESQKEQLVSYIKNQEKHHATKTFVQEIDEFIKRYGWQILDI
ncbi:transposase [Mucilaginibacter sp. dw_454]|uniref:transposase n=1 Tax=Mucilaginibacter sp. dw_454 TaxID=2720079 RepID=UPI001BD2DFDE|nr:transposase [Mucilaginibacter sp. dw_454]